MTTKRSPVPRFSLPAWLLPHVAEVRTWPAVVGPNPRCRVAVCDRTVHSLGLCGRHYDLFRAHARQDGQSLANWLPEHVEEVTGAPGVAGREPCCWVSVCGRTAQTNGLCKAHHRVAKYRYRQSAGVVLTHDSEPPVARLSGRSERAHPAGKSRATREGQEDATEARP